MADGSTALAFGALLGGAIIIEYGVRAFKSDTGATGGSAVTAATPSDGGASAPANATTYTKPELENLWVTNGGNPAKASLAAAVAMAESGGRVHATDDDGDGSVDRGLWQINSVDGSLSTYDVVQNVKAAISISDNGENWSPWVTYVTGAYRKYL